MWLRAVLLVGVASSYVLPHAKTLTTPPTAASASSPSSSRPAFAHVALDCSCPERAAAWDSVAFKFAAGLGTAWKLYEALPVQWKLHLFSGTHAVASTVLASAVLSSRIVDFVRNVLGTVARFFA